MTTPDGIRVSHAERDAVAGSLREHFAEGRLTIDELNERLDATFAATTRSELDDVTRDLPHVANRYMPLPSQHPGSGWDGRRNCRGSNRIGAGAFAGLLWALFLVMIVMAILSGIGGRPGGIAVLVLAVLAVGRRLLRRLWRIGTGSGRGRRR